MVKEVHLRCIEPEGSRRFDSCHWHGAKHHFKLFSSSVSSGKSRFKMSVRVVCTFVSPYVFPIQLAEHGSYEPKAEVSFRVLFVFNVDHYLHSFCLVSKGFKPLTEHVYSFSLVLPIFVKEMTRTFTPPFLAELAQIRQSTTLVISRYSGQYRDSAHIFIFFFPR